MTRAFNQRSLHGVRNQPRELGVSREEVESALTSVREYVQKEGLFHSIINEKKIGRKMAAGLCEGLDF